MSLLSEKHVAVVGSGAAGLSAAWLLSHGNRVTLIESEERLGGHAHTARVVSTRGSELGIDTGFIVYNEPSYPNLTRWYEALGVRTEASDMSFAVSRGGGRFEYAGGPLLGLLAQPTLAFSPRMWRMLIDLLRFYREAPTHIPDDGCMTLGEYLCQNGYSKEFMDDHLLPFGAAIWSTPRELMLQYPAASFIRFCENHGLLKIRSRPQWRTVSGGSDHYVQAVARCLKPDAIRTGFAVKQVERDQHEVRIRAADGRCVNADAVVLATHADQALAILQTPSEDEHELLGVFRYTENRAVLHSDISHLPKRRRAWCSWNYVESEGGSGGQVSLSYWMNRLQNLDDAKRQYIVTLNPDREPDAEGILRDHVYRHPQFSAATWEAQQKLWSLQGKNRTWYCGSYFGAGFHEDAIQAGLAVAEQLGGKKRPWELEHPSSRIVVSEDHGGMESTAA